MYMFFEKKQWLQDQNDSNDIRIQDVLTLDACTFVYTVSVMQMSRWAWTLEIYCCQLPSCTHQANFEKTWRKIINGPTFLMYPITNKNVSWYITLLLFERPSGGNESFGFHTRDDRGNWGGVPGPSWPWKPPQHTTLPRHLPQTAYHRTGRWSLDGNGGQ